MCCKPHHGSATVAEHPSQAERLGYVDLAAELGYDLAVQLTGKSARTLRSWAKKAGRTVPYGPNVNLDQIAVIGLWLLAHRPDLIGQGHAAELILQVVDELIATVELLTADLAAAVTVLEQLKASP